MIHDVYLRTAGRPIEAVQQGLAEVERIWGSRLKICGVGTTGSGRELIAEFVGADAVKANGGQVLHGPVEVPGGDWIVQCMDPQGAVFSLHQRAA